MTDGISKKCNTGKHTSCLGCPRCTCHPRQGRPAPVWDPKSTTQTDMRGSHNPPPLTQP